MRIQAQASEVRRVVDQGPGAIATADQHHVGVGRFIDHAVGTHRKAGGRHVFGGGTEDAHLPGGLLRAVQQVPWQVQVDVGEAVEDDESDAHGSDDREVPRARPGQNG